MVTLQDLDFSERLEFLLRFRIARSVICFHLLCAGVAYPQRTASSFGPTIDHSLSYTPIGLAYIPSLSKVVVIGQETPAVYLYAVNPSGEFMQTDLIALPNHATQIVAQPSTSKGVAEFCLLSDDGEAVSVIHRTKNGFDVKSVQVETPSQRVVVGDINNDRRQDLLLFGKKRTGITTLLKQKDGGYVTGPLVFPDLSIGDLQCTDLNGDGIADLLVLNWLSNQLALFYGIGRGVFSEQVEVPLLGEPANIAVSPVTKERTVRIAVSIPEENLVSMFHCSATGEIEPSGSLKFPTAPFQVQFADINDDKVLDLVVVTQQAVYVFLGKSSTTLGPPTPFGGGIGFVSSTVADLDGDLKSDLVLIDRAGKRLVAYVNSNWAGSVRWPPTYGVGSSPSGIATLDVNGDGMLDIAIANSGSSTLSVLLNCGEGRLDGQQVISVPEKPLSVKIARWLPSKGHTLVTAHETGDKISIVRIVDDVATAEVSTLPTGSNPYVVFAKQDSATGQLELMARCTDTKNGSLSLSLFQQISGGQFLERSLRPSLPGHITALTVDGYGERSGYELAFVTHDNATKLSTLALAFQSQGFEFKTVRPVHSFPDSTASVHSMLSGYVDDDLQKDLVLPMSAPRNALGFVYRKGENTFTDSIETIRNAQPLNEDGLILRDVNGDGHMDLTWIDVGRNAVVTVYGRGNRKFDPPINICTANHITAIEIASIKLPKIQDLILVDGTNGSTTIMFNPFR